MYKTYVAVSQSIKIKDEEDLLIWEVKDAYTYLKKYLIVD